jgi:hypothetical protein
MLATCTPAMVFIHGDDKVFAARLAPQWFSSGWTWSFAPEADFKLNLPESGARFLKTRRLVRQTAWRATSSSLASSTTQFAENGLRGISLNLSRILRGFGDASGLCARLWLQKYRQRALRLCIEYSRSWLSRRDRFADWVGQPVRPYNQSVQRGRSRRHATL